MKDESLAVAVLAGEESFAVEQRAEREPLKPLANRPDPHRCDGKLDLPRRFRLDRLAAVKEVRVSGADGAAAKVLGAKAAAVPGNYPADKAGDSEVEVELDLPKEAKPGAVKLTAVAAGGAG